MDIVTVLLILQSSFLVLCFALTFDSNSLKKKVVTLLSPHLLVIPHDSLILSEGLKEMRDVEEPFKPFPCHFKIKQVFLNLLERSKRSKSQNSNQNLVKQNSKVVKDSQASKENRKNDRMQSTLRVHKTHAFHKTKMKISNEVICQNESSEDHVKFLIHRKLHRLDRVKNARKSRLFVILEGQE